MQEVHQELQDIMLRFHKLRISAIVPTISQSDCQILLKIKCHEKENAEGEGMKMSLLADKMHVSSPSISRTIRHLEEKGLVKRQIALKDRRNTYVVITKKGEALLMETQQIMREFHEAVFSRLGENKVQFLLETLQSLYDICEDEIEKRSSLK